MSFLNLIVTLVTVAGVEVWLSYKLRRLIRGLDRTMEKGFDQIDRRFDQLDQRFGQVNERPQLHLR